MSQKSRIPPPSKAFRKTIAIWFENFERFNQQRFGSYPKWKEHFLDGEGLKDLWAVQVKKRRIKRGRQLRWIRRHPCKPEQILDCLSTDKLSLADIPEILKTKQGSLSEDIKPLLKLKGKRETQRAAVNLKRSAELIERYERTLMLFNRGKNFRSKELAETLRNYARKISELPSSRGRRQEVLLKFVGIALMQLLNNNTFDPPWALAGSLMHATFSPDPWTASPKTSGRALKGMLKDALREKPIHFTCDPIRDADPGQLGPW